MITSLVKVANLSIPIVKMIARMNGWNEKLVDDNIEVVNMLISSIKESGKYETLQDILNDEQLMADLTNMLSSVVTPSSHVEDVETNAITLDVDSTITCPKCGHVTTFRILKKYNEKS